MAKCISFSLIMIISVAWPAEIHGYNQLDSFTDNLLQEVIGRMSSGNERLSPNFDHPDLDDYPLMSSSAQRNLYHQQIPHKSNDAASQRVAKEYEGHAFRPRHDNVLGREPSIRDQEYLEHSSLFGHQYVQGGAGEGLQRLKPDGSVRNTQIVKSDGVLPAYCNPPNPCPLGYSAEDGCLENFVNTAAFSQAYQASQECICDGEHMFDCPGATRENEIDALARSIQNEGIMDSTLNRLVANIEINNPYLEGDKLPVVAKKAP